MILEVPHDALAFVRPIAREAKVQETTIRTDTSGPDLTGESWSQDLIGWSETVTMTSRP